MAKKPLRPAQSWFIGPPLGVPLHGALDQAAFTPELEVKARRVPARAEWNGGSRSVRAAALMRAVSDILDCAPVRRTTREKLDAQKGEIAGLLFGARRLHDWYEHHGRDSRVVAGTLRVRGKIRPVIVHEAAELLPRINALRQYVKRAQRQWDKLPKSAQPARFAAAYGRLFFARQGLSTAMEEFNSRRTGLPAVSTKHRIKLEHAAVLGVLGPLYDYGLPDSTIAALLAAAILPDLTPRNIKRYRTGA